MKSLLQTKQYQKALVAADKQIEEELRLNEHALQGSHYRMKGEISDRWAKGSATIFGQIYFAGRFHKAK